MTSTIKKTTQNNNNNKTDEKPKPCNKISRINHLRFQDDVIHFQELERLSVI